MAISIAAFWRFRQEKTHHSEFDRGLALQKLFEGALVRARTVVMDEEQMKQVMADIRTLQEGQKHIENEIARLHELAAADVKLIYSNMEFRDKLREK